MNSAGFLVVKRPLTAAAPMSGGIASDRLKLPAKSASTVSSLALLAK